MIVTSAAEAAKHLTELETDVTAADDDQMLRQKSTDIIELLVRKSISLDARHVEARARGRRR